MFGFWLSCLLNVCRAIGQSNQEAPPFFICPPVSEIEMDDSPQTYVVSLYPADGHPVCVVATK